MRLDYAAEAIAEVDEALAYYRAIDPALSKKLVTGIDESIRLILAMPFAWKSIGENLRQCHVKVFPIFLFTPFSRIQLVSSPSPIPTAAQTTGAPG
jgi:hypothetical protein